MMISTYLHMFIFIVGLCLHYFYTQSDNSKTHQQTEVNEKIWPDQVSSNTDQSTGNQWNYIENTVITAALVTICLLGAAGWFQYYCMKKMEKAFYNEEKKTEQSMLPESKAATRTSDPESLIGQTEDDDDDYETIEETVVYYDDDEEEKDDDDYETIEETVVYHDDDEEEKDDDDEKEELVKKPVELEKLVDDDNSENHKG
ncbi:glutamic acid-rich protein-like [Xenopus laevis]|uniref:Glutamic acid-rich protein-like n=1 Tax=Xenopus laevis TaxID=8355 RepID=A0A8J1L064_XENLA|nr:glutamic acid-rich protein-like [Xenopus laevis]XP_041422935.1 glutamic acid-rich protein-like [Xenopus laevis]XP_041422936.1 glutamic acid-rich protein-like [Xenopus laevis]XP_041422937.1 glutamic acid-rich protein-like [Xenopus laevis]